MHVVRGTFRKDRHDPSKDVEPTPTAPEHRPKPPAPLHGPARAEWNRLVARKIADGTLSKTDDALLYQAASLFGEIEELSADRRRQIQFVQSLRRRIAKFPATELAAVVEQIGRLEKTTVRLTTQIRAGRQTMRQLLSELGLSPLTRGRCSKTLSGMSGPQLSPADKFRARKRGA